jgi:pectin methylesterase-like acyl-CoA thioesterase
MRKLSSLVVAALLGGLFVGPTGGLTPATASAAVRPTLVDGLAPAHGGAGVCVDNPLRLTFDHPPQLGQSGAIRVHRADGTVVDTIDLADPATYQRTIGDAVSDSGVLHKFAYSPVIVADDTATIYLHRQLDYGQRYYVTVDPGVFVGSPGITDSRTWRFATKRFPPHRGTSRLRVSASGRGDFCTVQGAIDFVPEGNSRPVVIDVAAGVYTEIDYVRADRAHITVRGAGRDRTVIQYANNDKLNGDAHLLNTPDDANLCPHRVLPTPDIHNCWRALFGVDAPDFRLTDITLRNTTPYGGSQAEAFRGNGERIVLDRVNLLSFQDTLRLQGMGFVTDSYIEGDVDFIWGTGTIFVQNSELKAMHAGYYTQIRNDGTRNGAVFVHDRLTRAPDVPDASVYLSRIETNRFPYSQVVFIGTAMDAHIKPVAWQITPNDCSQAPDLRFWEYGSTDLAGSPVDVSQRLACSRQLTAAEAAPWRDPRYVFGGWSPGVVGR